MTEPALSLPDLQSLPDERARAAVCWAAARLDTPVTAVAPASADASFRRYFRVHGATGSRIVMDAPPAQEDSTPFLRVAELMRQAGLRVPMVYAADLAQGFLLLSDLGTRTFLDAMTVDNAEGYFARAHTALLLWQGATRTGLLPAYSHSLLAREVALFREWYLGRHLQLTLDHEEQAALHAVEAVLVQRALAQGQVFVHRDFMPRNLMDSEQDAAGVLDFQDAVVGPVSYDAISLYRDAFVSWPDSLVQDGLDRYHQAARAAGLPVPTSRTAFQADCDWMGLQRHLKVTGIFARLTLRDGKPKYLADTPRFIDYIMAVAPRYPELLPLARLVERHVLPRLP
ncbi:phosphotransferase [Algiphilus sp.]|uniref:aminoglycoside phosphotransferase family protein n=1 Tax=Algiphilus sp. TaxID=1872431 RepID=UPI002A675B91|nr:phosphotransferase [Pseudomonadota bacterium]